MGNRFLVPTVNPAGMTLLSTTTLTGASVTLSSIPGNYTDLRLVIRNFRPATDAATLNMRFNADATASRHGRDFNVTATAFGATENPITAASDNGASSSLVAATIYDYANTSTWKIAQIHSAIANNQTTTTSFNSLFNTVFYNQTGAITSLLLIPSSGNFTSGTALLYGVN